MGGDEFCVLASAAQVGPGALISAAATALSIEGEGFRSTAHTAGYCSPRRLDAFRTHCGSPTAACTSTKTGTGRPLDARAWTCCSASCTSATRSWGDISSVADLVEAVGRRLRVPTEQLETLRQAAELHDIGKVSIPEPILSKPTALTEAEWEIVRRHPLVGERILTAAPALGQVARLVRSTHERFDGTGYPDGLKGHEIPLGARIIAVCDAFDAMTSERAYAPTLTAEEARRELLRCRARRITREVVRRSSKSTRCGSATSFVASSRRASRQGFGMGREELRNLSTLG